MRGIVLPTVESIAQTPAGRRQLQLISTLSEAEPLDRNRQVGVSALYDEAKKRGTPKESVTSDLEALQDLGWPWFERSMAGIQTVVLKQTGIDAAEEVKALRMTGSVELRRFEKRSSAGCMTCTSTIKTLQRLTTS
jgi:hypothetical protein